jgi:hypothetical protein
MRRWSFVHLLALAGVLLHTAALAYHHRVMLGAHLERQHLLRSLAAYCHSLDRTTLTDAELPGIPVPSEEISGCLICKGLVSALALVPQVQVDATPPRMSAAARPVPRHEAPPRQIADVRPPVRGPPHLL